MKEMSQDGSQNKTVTDKCLWLNQADCFIRQHKWTSSVGCQPILKHRAYASTPTMISALGAF